MIGLGMLWDLRLESTSHVVGVLAAVVGGLANFTAVVLVFEDLFGVLLGLFGGVWRAH